MAATKYTHRYRAYCRSWGEADPAAMLERDRERFPGGVMTGFILWIRARWAEWMVLQGRQPDRPSCPAPVLSTRDHADFDAWLAAEVPGA